MKQDIIIGAADLYEWSHVKNWVRSIKQSGFEGNTILLCYRVSEDLIHNCSEEGVTLFHIDSDRFNQPIQHGIAGHASDVHQLRFFHFWQALSTLGLDNYRYCIATDVRDVIFQTNPSEWLESNLVNHKYTIPSELIKYEDESWNNNNALTSLGPIVYTQLFDKPVANVGTIGGDASFLANLFLTLHTMTIGLSLPSDQSCFNLLSNGILQDQGLLVGDKAGWCAQLGVSCDESKQHLQEHLLDLKPVIKEGLVYNQDGQLYSLVHQYDRIPDLNNIINTRYQCLTL